MDTILQYFIENQQLYLSEYLTRWKTFFSASRYNAPSKLTITSGTPWPPLKLTYHAYCVNKLLINFSSNKWAGSIQILMTQDSLGEIKMPKGLTHKSLGTISWVYACECEWDKEVLDRSVHPHILVVCELNSASGIFHLVIKNLRVHKGAFTWGELCSTQKCLNVKI